MSQRAHPEPSPHVSAFTPPVFGGGRTWIDLRLDGNEGCPVPDSAMGAIGALSAELVHRYPQPGRLEEVIARHFSLPAGRVLATAGVDEGLDRFCRATLSPGRKMVIAEPTFEMLPRYVRLAGAEVVSVPWIEGYYPLDAVLAAVTPDTHAVAFVSPNNPTGLVGRREELERLLAALPHVWVAVDLAYGEFALEDLTETALAYPNAVVFRTFSKAWGLAGLRVGAAFADPQMIRWMRAAGSPFTVSSLSAEIVAARLARPRDDLDEFIANVHCERRELFAHLESLGARPWPTQANFVLARFADAAWVETALASLGIAVRRLPAASGLDGAIRITCPGNDLHFSRLRHALATAMAPRCLVIAVEAIPEGWFSSQDAQSAIDGRWRLVIAGRRDTDELRVLAERAGLDARSSTVVTMPATTEIPRRSTLRAAIGLDRALLLTGDPGDVAQARASGVVPIGIAAPGDEARSKSFDDVGVARVITRPRQISELPS